MKKILLSFAVILIAANSYSQAGASTASLQTLLNAKIDTLKAIEGRIQVRMDSSIAVEKRIRSAIQAYTVQSISNFPTGFNVNNFPTGFAIVGTPTVAINSSTTVLTTSPSSVTTSGTVTAGAKTILFETSGDFTGTINGLPFLGNGFLSYPPVTGYTWPAIPYVVTTGTLNIRKSN